MLSSQSLYLNPSANIFTCLLTCALIIACETKAPESNSSTQDISLADDIQLSSGVYSEHIEIVPTMRSDLPYGNTVQCSNIEYLWHVIIVNSDKDILDNPLAKEFQQSPFWRNTMDTSKLVLAFGKPDDVYRRVIHQYSRKYGLFKNDFAPQGDTFWGYTDKVVNYKYAEPFDEQPLKFLGTEVFAFGFDSGFNSVFIKEHFKNQFEILYYGSNGEFVVKLKPSDTKDEIILAMLNKRTTFLDMFNRTSELVKKGKEQTKQNASIYHLNAEDELIIPIIRFKAKKSYSSLEGLQFSSRYGAVGSFEQAINFNFDRNGVVLEATVSLSDSVGAPQEPKILRFDKPFYLFVKEQNATHPYFNLWVADTAILERALR